MYYTVRCDGVAYHLVDECGNVLQIGYNKEYLLDLCLLLNDARERRVSNAGLQTTS